MTPPPDPARSSAGDQDPPAPGADGRRPLVAGHALVPLPEAGSGSAAGWPARVLALLVDWLLGNLAAVVLVGTSVWSPAEGGPVWVPLICWLVLVWLATAFTGASFGQWLLRLRVAHVRGERIGVLRAGARTALIGLVIPPLVFTVQGRGLHDLLADTVVVRA